MAKVIRYTLINGSKPSFVIAGNGAESGQWQNPADMSILGITNETTAQEGIIEFFDTKADLLAYMESYMTGWTYYSEGEELPLNISEKADILWSYV